MAQLSTVSSEKEELQSNVDSLNAKRDGAEALLRASSSAREELAAGLASTRSKPQIYRHSTVHARNNRTVWMAGGAPACGRRGASWKRGRGTALRPASTRTPGTWRPSRPGRAWSQERRRNKAMASSGRDGNKYLTRKTSSLPPRRTVAIRMRPLNSRETSVGRVWRVLSKYASVTQCTPQGKLLPERTNGRNFFAYDRAFGESATTRQVYDATAVTSSGA